MIDSDVLNSDVTLTGVMEGKTFTITIKSNNSNNQTRTYSAKYGERFTLPSCPFSAVTNYTFNNYTCNGSNYSVGGGFTVTGNMTVTCNWTYHAPAPPAPANKAVIRFEIMAQDQNTSSILYYYFDNVTGSYVGSTIYVKFYWPKDIKEGYADYLRLEKETPAPNWFGGFYPAPMGWIHTIEIYNREGGSLLARKSVTLKPNATNNITFTLTK